VKLSFDLFGFGVMGFFFGVCVIAEAEKDEGVFERDETLVGWSYEIRRRRWRRKRRRVCNCC